MSRILPIAPEHWPPPRAAIELDGLQLAPKPELHVTLVGRALAAELQATFGQHADARVAAARDALDWPFERIGRFLLLHKQLDPDDDEITRTRKVRRNVIDERYADLISALRTGQERVGITSRITYQDGSSVDRELSLRIFDLSTYSIPEGRGRRPVWSGRR